MQGLMQHRPLLISTLIEHAARFHGNTEIVSATVEGGRHRTTWAEVHERAQRLANVLQQLGVAQGDRVASLAWNTHRHLELYFGVSGSGAILHTVNPRLYPEQIDYILNHAEDQYVFFDISFASLLAELAPRLPKVRGFIALTSREHMPDVDLPNLLCYEELLAAAEPHFDWPMFDENTASSLCYTSGTTGNPKGVLYSHRSTVLHSWVACTADGLALSARDTVMLVVPLFHVNAWGIPYAAAMCGAKLVLPGPALDGASLYSLLRDEQCNFSLGVPTVWLGLFDYIDRNRASLKLDELALRRVVVGGSAAPRALAERFDRELGAFLIQAWGMTETSPLATVGTPLQHQQQLEPEARYDMQARQGRAIYGVELKIIDADGKQLAHDGEAAGDLYVRGPWVVASYFGVDSQPLDADGWFPTGDVARIDRDGFVQITDRSKDVIKSGGEWISSIDLENAAIGHASVREAAVIGVTHARWQERPLMLVVLREGATFDEASLRDYLATRVAKWWLPDEILVVDELPHTATGKLQKVTLRDRYRAHRLATDPA